MKTMEKSICSFISPEVLCEMPGPSNEWDLEILAMMDLDKVIRASVAFSKTYFKV